MCIRDSPPPIEVVDTIGAGDSFAGSFLTWWLDHDLAAADLTQLAPVAQATVAAQEVAAFTCRQVGAQPPRRAQLSAAWHD